MSDDRDRRRVGDPLHKPDSGKGRLRPASGEVDSDDAWRDELTPTARPVPTVVVQSSEFDVDIRWREFDAMREEVRLCAQERMAGQRRKKWITGAITGALGSVGVALAFAIRALSAHGAAGEVERQQREMVRAHEIQIRTIQTQQAAAAALLDVLLRRPSAPNP